MSAAKNTVSCLGTVLLRPYTSINVGTGYSLFQIPRLKIGHYRNLFNLATSLRDPFQCMTESKADLNNKSIEPYHNR